MSTTKFENCMPNAETLPCYLTTQGGSESGRKSYV